MKLVNDLVDVDGILVAGFAFIWWIFVQCFDSGTYFEAFVVLFELHCLVHMEL